MEPLIIVIVIYIITLIAFGKITIDNYNSNEIQATINRNTIAELRKDFDLLVQHLDLHYEDPPRRIIKKS